MIRRNITLLASLLVLTTLEPAFASSGSTGKQTTPTVGNRRQAVSKLRLDFKPPKKGAPTATAGGASRSFCVTGKTPLTILTPSTNLGLTTATHPTFFLYVPKTAAKTAEFVIKDADDNDVYRSMVELAEAPGVVSISLPSTAPALQPDKNYRWFFSMICRPGDRLEDVFVSSWIQRVEPNLTLSSALKKADLRQQTALYAEAGLWYDTLTALANLRRADPGDSGLTQQWMSLLQSVGLASVSDAPLVVEPKLSGVN